MLRLFLPGLLLAAMPLGAAAAAQPDCAEPSDEGYCQPAGAWLPQYRADFDPAEVSGRYAVDCGEKEEGVRLVWDGSRESLNLSVGGVPVPDAFQPLAYFGPLPPPAGFVLPIMYTDPATGEDARLTLNADYHGFYLLEDSAGGRRLSRCADQGS